MRIFLTRTFKFGIKAYCWERLTVFQNCICSPKFFVCVYVQCEGVEPLTHRCSSGAIIL
jgi:hypothetical protein